MFQRVVFDEKFYERITAFLAKEKQKPNSPIFQDKHGIIAYYARNYHKLSKNQTVAERLKLTTEAISTFVSEKVGKPFNDYMGDEAFAETAAWPGFFTAKRKVPSADEISGNPLFRYMFYAEKSGDNYQWQMWNEWVKALYEAGFDFKSARMEDIGAEVEAMGPKVA